MQDAPLNAFQAPLSANTMQLQAAPTGGLYDPLNQAVLGHYQAQREQNAAEQASVERNAMIQAKMDELTYQHGRDTKSDARQAKLDKVATAKAAKKQRQLASTAKVIRATGKAKGLDLSMYADDELVQANKDKTLADLYRASEPKVVKPVSVIGMANESESALVHKMIMSQLGTKEGDVNTGKLEASVSSMAGVLQAQHAKQGKMISYMDAVNAVIGKLAPKLVTTGADDYIPFNENTTVQFNE